MRDVVGKAVEREDGGVFKSCPCQRHYLALLEYFRVKVVEKVNEQW